MTSGIPLTFHPAPPAEGILSLFWQATRRRRTGVRRAKKIYGRIWTVDVVFTWHSLQPYGCHATLWSLNFSSSSTFRSKLEYLQYFGLWPNSRKTNDIPTSICCCALRLVLRINVNKLKQQHYPCLVSACQCCHSGHVGLLAFSS